MFARMNDWYAPMVINGPIEKFGALVVDVVMENASDNSIWTDARINACYPEINIHV